MTQIRWSLIMIVACAFFVVSIVPGQTTSAKLRYNFTPGQKLIVTQYEHSDDTDESPLEEKITKTSSSKEISQNWEVVSVSPQGDATINFRYTALINRKTIAPGVEVILDTSKSVVDSNPILRQAGPEAIEKMETARKMMSDVFLARTYKLSVSNTGIVRSVSGFEPAWEEFRLKAEKIMPDKAKRAELGALIEAFFGEEAVHKLFSYSLFSGLPEQNVSVGHQWSDSTFFDYESIRMPIKRTYRLVSFTPNATSFKIDGSLVFETPSPTAEIEFRLPASTLQTAITLDPADGVMFNQTYKGKLDFEAYLRGDAPVKVMRVLSVLDGYVKIVAVR